MANELSVTIKFSFSKGGVKLQPDDFTDDITVAGDNALHHVQNIGITEEAITLGDVVAGGYWLVRNLDATNFVELRSGTGAGNDILKLKPGEAQLIRFGTDVTAPFAIADTAPCNVEFIMLDD